MKKSNLKKEYIPLKGKKTFIVENYPINVNKSTIKKIIQDKIKNRDVSKDGTIILFERESTELNEIFYSYLGLGTAPGSKKQRDKFHKNVNNKITELLHDEDVFDDDIG